MGGVTSTAMHQTKIGKRREGMEVAEIDPNAKINLSSASVLLVDGSQHSLALMAQIMKGFGVAEIARCASIDEAEKSVRGRTFDLIVVDPDVDGGAGYSFLHALRHSTGSTNAHVPVILVSGNARKADVARARDTGANFFVTKPLTPNVLLQRVMFVARDKREFVEVGEYIGPSRRFKFEGPPTGEGRRNNDLQVPLGSADGPNLSQNEVDNLIKPQRVVI